MRRSILLALCVLAAACSPDYDPASKIEKLRVVAIQAEPPEIDPGGVQTAALTSLVLRADFDAEPDRTTTVVHFACAPEPGQVAPTPCVMMANLDDPTALLAEAVPLACLDPAVIASVMGPGAPALAGVEACVGASCATAALPGIPDPAVSVTAGLRDRFLALPAGAPDRIIGTQVVDLAFALDAAPAELAGGSSCPRANLLTNLARLWKVREHVLSTKRIAIRGSEPKNPANRNPAVDGILLGGVPLDAAGATTVVTGEHELSPHPAGTPETYAKLDASGATIEVATEQWVYSWFSTAGEFKHLHTRGSDETDRWTIFPDSHGRARVAVVVRDLRGGIAWVVRDVGLAP